MTNQRKSERIKATTFATVYNLQNRTLLGFLGDLTLRGVMVVGEKAVETGHDTVLEIEFRGAAEVPGGRLTIPVHVAWSRQEAGSTYFHTGFEFLKVTEQSKRVIETLVERYRFSSEVI